MIRIEGKIVHVATRTGTVQIGFNGALHILRTHSSIQAMKALMDLYRPVHEGFDLLVAKETVRALESALTLAYALGAPEPLPPAVPENFPVRMVVNTRGSERLIGLKSQGDWEWLADVLAQIGVYPQI